MKFVRMDKDGDYSLVEKIPSADVEVFGKLGHRICYVDKEIIPELIKEGTIEHIGDKFVHTVAK